MKKVFSILFYAIMIIIFSPIIILILLIFGIFNIIWFIKEYPKYRKSLCYQETKIRYSHGFYISEYYRIYDKLCNVNSIKLIRENKYSHYFKGENIYFFRDCGIYFKIEDSILYISLDGAPFTPFNDYIEKIKFKDYGKKYLLVFEEEAVNDCCDFLDLSEFDNIIVGKDYFDFVQKIEVIENQSNKL